MSVVQRSLGQRVLGQVLWLSFVLLTIAPGFAQSGIRSDKEPLDGQGLASLLKGETDAVPQGEDFRYIDAHLEPVRARIRYLIRDKVPLEVVLVNKNSNERAYKESASFKIYYAAAPEMDDDTESAFMKALDQIIETVIQNDDGRWRIPNTSPGFGAQAKNSGSSEASGTKSNDAPMSMHLIFGLVLFLGALVWLPTLLRYAWQSFRGHTKNHQMGMGGLVTLGAFIRWIVVPHLVVTMYMGFKLADRAAYLQEHFRYGVGAQVMWHGLFEITGPDHAYLIGLNSLLAIFSLLWLVSILTRAGFNATGLLFALALLALMPMNIWSDASDSLTVPVMFWTLGATVFAQRVLDHGRVWDLWGAVLWLGMAAHTRPEHMLFGPLFVFLVLAFQAGRGPLPGARDLRKSLLRLYRIRQKSVEVETRERTGLGRCLSRNRELDQTE